MNTLNSSFSKYGVSSPVECGFYVMEVANSILEKYDISKITKEVFVDFYDSFLKNKIGKDLNSFIEERTDIWLKKDKSFNYNTLKNYVRSVFVERTFEGIKREQVVYNKINELINSDFRISHSDPENDNNTGIDFLIKGNDLKIGIQVKPISFIRGLKGTTKYSLKKIMKGKPSNIPLFIITECNNDIKVHLKSKNKNTLMTMELEKFLSYLYTIDTDKFNQISNDTLNQMLKF